MGSSASKAARTAAAGAAKRQYPTRVPPTSSPITNPPGATSSAPAPSQAQAHAAETAARINPSGPHVHPQLYASNSRDPSTFSPPGQSLANDVAITADGFDPQLAASLRKLGPVQTAPTYSATSTAPPTSPDEAAPEPSAFSHSPVVPSPGTNPALLVLEARRRLADRAEAEAEQVGRRGFTGRAFVDVMTIRRALALRDERGMSERRIEETLSLKRGTMGKLGAKGVLRDAGEGIGSELG